MRQTAFGTEFFSNAPCLAYVIRGTETFFDADGEETTVQPGDTLLVPRHHHMISDFSNAEGPLEAYLFFFSDAVIGEYLSATARRVAAAPASKTAIFAGSPSLRAYVDALPKVYGDLSAPPTLVKAKLLELLLLLHMHDADGQLHNFLVHENANRARRNIKQIMRAHALADLSIADYATLSGRSVSAFQRDFKREFGEPPSVWLRRARLEHADDKVVNTEDTIADIAIAAGFSDTSHFIKAYKSLFNETPKQRRLHLA
ncbi:MAG: AraC family transcriptional regulator [Pseudomonadota bacterium]